MKVGEGIWVGHDQNTYMYEINKEQNKCLEKLDGWMDGYFGHWEGYAQR